MEGLELLEKIEKTRMTLMLKVNKQLTFYWLIFQSESLSEDSFGVLQNNWMIEAQKGEISVDEDPKMKELKLQMISRQENVQVLSLLKMGGDIKLCQFPMTILPNTKRPQYNKKGLFDVKLRHLL